MIPLRDCVSINPQEAELFVVSSHRLFDLACKTRDRVTQAVVFINESTVPLGDPTVDELLDDEEFRQLISTLGVGVDLSSFWGSMSDALFDLRKLRYGKILLLADDGPTAARVRDQLITWFFLYFHPVLENGHVFDFAERPSDEISPADFEERFMRHTRLTLRGIVLGETLSETLSLN